MNIAECQFTVDLPFGSKNATVKAQKPFTLTYDEKTGLVKVVKDGLESWYVPTAQVAWMKGP